jgi:hypothetical protein
MVPRAVALALAAVTAEVAAAALLHLQPLFQQSQQLERRLRLCFCQPAPGAPIPPHCLQDRSRHTLHVLLVPQLLRLAPPPPPLHGPPPPPHWIAAAPPATSPRLTLAEAILEAAGQVLHVPHAPAAGGLAADGLLTPLDCRAQQASRQAAAAHPDVSAVGPSARREMCNLLLQQCQRQPQPQVWRLLLVLLLLLQG